MIRNASEEWVQKLGQPLYLLINQSRSHQHGVFSQVRGAAMAVVANLAYCTISDEERADVKRATIIPSVAYQDLLHSAPDFDIVAVLSRLDFADPIIVRTRRFVAIGLPAKSDLWIGVRVVSRMWWKLPSSGLRACNDGSSQAARSRDIGSSG